MPGNSPTPSQLTTSEVFGRNFGVDRLSHDDKFTRLGPYNLFSGSEEQQKKAKFVFTPHRVEWKEVWDMYMGFRPEEKMRVRIQMDTETGTKLADEEAVDRFERIWNAYEYWRTKVEPVEPVAQVHIENHYIGFGADLEPKLIEVILRVTVGVTTIAEARAERHGEDADQDVNSESESCVDSDSETGV